ncbi:MAG: rhodanese-like domain-containing protein [Lentisphaeria bacterium]|nr:rhodanese-like domain-containing protein [Candidatus Neomarinimicrobiota bacterium]MCF7842943.1 rhodanese-like domain-containing protein [Lentisphaeria bacterium]
MRARNITVGIMLLLGLVIAMVPENTTKPYKLTADQLLRAVNTGTHMIHPDYLAEWLINKDPSIQLVDVRSPDDFEKYHLPNAINIPLADILNPDYQVIWDQGVKFNVLYSNGSTDSNEAWMILRQLGYQNLGVLMGGLNYWTEVIMNPEEPPVTSPNDEIAKYEFRKGASQALGGGAATTKTATTDTEIKKPKIVPRKAKKAPQGGC